MSGSRWTVQAPRLDDAAVLTEAPRLDPDEPILERQLFRGVRLSAPDPIENLQLLDVQLEGCDVAGLVAEGGRANTVRLSDCRLRGVTWARGLFDDLLAERLVGDEVSLRFSTLRRCILRGLDLPGLDLTEVTFDRVLIEDCRLAGATFDHCHVVDLRIQGCDLSGATGVAGLRGASIHPDDVASMSASLAVAAGLRVEDA